MFTKILAYHRVYLFCVFAAYIANLLAFLVVTESGCYMARQMVQLMYKAIKELRRRSHTAYHQHALSVAGVAQPRV